MGIHTPCEYSHDVPKNDSLTGYCNQNFARQEPIPPSVINSPTLDIHYDHTCALQKF